MPNTVSSACCMVGEVHEPCRFACRMPWSNPAVVDNIAATSIDEQRRRQHGGMVSSDGYPWVRIQQRVERSLQRYPSRPAAEHTVNTATPPCVRIAVCLAGAVRSFIHPAVGHAFERHVLGAAGPTARTDVFLVLGTGEEDHRARTNLLPIDDQDYLRSKEGALHLSRAINRLSPVAVEFDTGPGSASCGVPPTGQFAKLARCIDLARAHERAQVALRALLWPSSGPPLALLWPSSGPGIVLWCLALCCAVQLAAYRVRHCAGLAV